MTLCAKPLLAAAAIWAASAGGCATAESNGEHLRACIERIAEQSDFSGVAYVARNAEAVAVVARGVRAAPGSALITPDTRFNIASAGKMFTAVAVGQLVDEGKVKFDDPIGKHVLGLPPTTAAVTIRHLLTHMSGLGNFFTPDNMEALRSVRSANDLLPLIDEPTFPPGTEFHYSNSGYALLGVLIERATGTTYGERLDERIFRPAGMTASDIDPEPLETLAVGMTSRQRESVRRRRAPPRCASLREPQSAGRRRAACSRPPKTLGSSPKPCGAVASSRPPLWRPSSRPTSRPILQIPNGRTATASGYATSMALDGSATMAARRAPTPKSSCNRIIGGSSSCSRIAIRRRRRECSRSSWQRSVLKRRRHALPGRLPTHLNGAQRQAACL